MIRGVTRITNSRLDRALGRTEKLADQRKISKDGPFGDSLHIGIRNHTRQNQRLAITNTNFSSIKRTAINDIDVSTSLYKIHVNSSRDLRR